MRNFPIFALDIEKDIAIKGNWAYVMPILKVHHQILRWPCTVRTGGSSNLVQLPWRVGLQVRLAFYQFSVLPHTVYAVLTQWCYIFVLYFFSKMFDTELCPLPFSLEEMFGFISCRFTGYPSSVQEQALLWLHVSVLTWQVMLKQLIILKENLLFQSWCAPCALCLAPI